MPFLANPGVPAMLGSIVFANSYLNQSLNALRQSVVASGNRIPAPPIPPANGGTEVPKGATTPPNTYVPVAGMTALQRAAMVREIAARIQAGQMVDPSEVRAPGHFGHPQPELLGQVPANTPIRNPNPGGEPPQALPVGGGDRSERAGQQVRNLRGQFVEPPRAVPIAHPQGPLQPAPGTMHDTAQPGPSSVTELFKGAKAQHDRDKFILGASTILAGLEPPKPNKYLGDLPFAASIVGTSFTEGSVRGGPLGGVTAATITTFTLIGKALLIDKNPTSVSPQTADLRERDPINYPLRTQAALRELVRINNPQSDHAKSVIQQNPNLDQADLNYLVRLARFGDPDPRRQSVGPARDC